MLFRSGGTWNSTAGTCSNTNINQSGGSNATSTGSGANVPLVIDGASSEITSIINSILKIVYALSGISIIGVVIMGGIQYSSSNGNPQAVSAAKKKIQNAILALVVMAMLYPLIQWLIPGGAF